MDGRRVRTLKGFTKETVDEADKGRLSHKTRRKKITWMTKER